MLSLGASPYFHLPRSLKPRTLNSQNKLAFLTQRSLYPPSKAVKERRREEFLCASLDHEISDVEEVESDVQLDSSVFEEVFRSVPRVENPLGKRVRGLPSPQSTLIPDDWKPVQQYLHRGKRERREEIFALRKYWARKRALEERATPEEIEEIEQRFARGEELLPPNVLKNKDVVEAREEDGQLSKTGSPFLERKVVVGDKVNQEDIDNEQRFLRGESLVWADVEENGDNVEDEWQDDSGIGETKTHSGRAKPKDFRTELQFRSFEAIAQSLREEEVRSSSAEQIKEAVSEDLQAVKEQKFSFTPEEKAILRNKKLDFAKISSKTWSPLHTLAASGQVYLAAELLKRDIDIDKVDSDGLTPLHIAVRSGQKTMIRMLLKAGANPHVCDKEGATLLHYSAQIGNHEISKLLIRHDIDVNAADKDGWTPLHIAVQTGRTELIKALVYRGADITIENKDGNTAFDLALAFTGCFRFYDAVKFLKKQLTYNSMNSNNSKDNEDYDSMIYDSSADSFQDEAMLQDYD